MKKLKNQNSKSFLFGVAIAGAGVLTMLLSSTVFKDWIIIGFGVRTLNFVHSFGLGVTITGALLTAILSIPLIKASIARGQQQRQERARQEQQAQVLTNYAEDSANPEFTRERLEQLRREMPETGSLVAQCLKQMDRVDSLQAKQELLIRTNDARYLEDTVSALNDVERRICRNFRNIINLCIAADDPQNFDMTKINAYLNDNEKKLSNAQELLKASADWINQYDADRTGDRSQVENWIEVIRESLKED